MRSLRKYHHYIGVFFAPALILFSVSGALQTFRLTQASGYGSAPPAAFVWLASVHKDQALPQVEVQKPSKKPTSRVEKGQPPTPSSTLALKFFVVLLSIGLIVSTILGVIIALNNLGTRRISIAMLVAGSVLPVVLLYL